MYLKYFNSSLNTTSYVIDYQQYVSAIKAIFGLKTIIIGNVYCSAMDVRNRNSSCIHLMYYKMYQTQKYKFDVILTVHHR